MEYLGIPRYQEFSKVFELLNKNSDMQISIGGGKSALPLLEGSPQRFLVCAIPYSIKWPDLRRESDGKQENIEQWVVADSRQTCSSLFEGKEKFPFLFSSRKFPRALAATGEKMNRVGPIVVRLPNFPVGPKTFQFNMTVRLVTSVHVFPPPPSLKKENSLISRRIIKKKSKSRGETRKLFEIAKFESKERRSARIEFGNRDEFNPSLDFSETVRSIDSMRIKIPPSISFDSEIRMLLVRWEYLFSTVV